MTHRSTRATIYWDTQDPANLGWAYRIAGGESGPIDSPDAIDAIQGLVDQTEGDLYASLAAIADALPDGVKVADITYAEDCEAIAVDLYP
jgi:hypothetical protein